ncbi:MAG: DUF2357 domain-containing protein [Candidatus Bathyarchaeia archaeon]
MELKHEGHFAFWHENPLLRLLIQPVGRNSKIYSGVINFGSEVGESEFIFLWNGQKVLTIKIEVYPRKIDYQLDYTQMLLEVHSEVQGLVFDLLTKTYRNVLPNRWKRSSAEIEWFSLLKYLFENLEQAVHNILRHPHHQLDYEERYCHLELLRRYDRSTLRWLRRRPLLEGLVTGKEKQPCPPQPKFPEKRKRVHYDTVENRFVRFVLEKTASRIKHLRLLYKKSPTFTAAGLGSLLAEMELKLRRLLRLGFLKDVGPFRPPTGVSLVLQFAPGYRELFRCYLLLERGLNIQGRALSIGLKAVHELYEYWCFLRLREILRRHYTIVSQDIIKTRANGMVLTLQKGSSGRIIFRGQDGSLIELGYNAYPEVQSPTTPQRPDMLLTIDRKTPGGFHRYIMDAKYRIDYTPDYIARYGGPGPREDDINMMHRYRDAFLAGNPTARIYSRDVLGACILFPWRGDFEKHHFYQSIRLVGIGALPFLPGFTHLVEKYLIEILEWSDVEHLNRAVLPRNHDFFWERRYRNNPVLVGTLGDKNHIERLNFARRLGYYHIPVEKFPAKSLGFEYIAFFGNGKIEWYAKVKDIAVVPEKDLPEIALLRPIQSKGGLGLYYRVDLFPDSWKNIDPPITNPSRQRFAFITTTLEALLTARTIGELRLKLETERRILEAVRLAKFPYDIMETKDGRWELVVNVINGKKLKIRRQTSVDGIEVWLEGLATPRRIPGSVVRQRPEYILEIFSGGTIGK